MEISISKYIKSIFCPGFLSPTEKTGLFQLDNAAIHRSIRVKHFMPKNVDVMAWLSRSPNLHPIEKL